MKSFQQVDFDTKRAASPFNDELSQASISSHGRTDESSKKNDRRTDFLMIRKKYSPHHLRGRFSPPLMGGFFSKCCVLASVRNESTQRRKHLIE